MAGPSKGVLVRDGAIFMVKLWIDGLKDIVLTALAIGALVLDLVFRKHAQHFLFYKVVRAGEKFDLFLNLYGGAKDVQFTIVKPLVPVEPAADQ